MSESVAMKCNPDPTKPSMVGVRTASRSGAGAPPALAQSREFVVRRGEPLLALGPACPAHGHPRGSRQPPERTRHHAALDQVPDGESQPDAARVPLLPAEERPAQAAARRPHQRRPVQLRSPLPACRSLQAAPVIGGAGAPRRPLNEPHPPRPRGMELVVLPTLQDPGGRGAPPCKVTPSVESTVRIQPARISAVCMSRTIGVSTGPGATALTRRPSSPSSTAITRVRVITAPLVAP